MGSGRACWKPAWGQLSLVTLPTRSTCTDLERVSGSSDRRIHDSLPEAAADGNRRSALGPLARTHRIAQAHRARHSRGLPCSGCLGNRFRGSRRGRRSERPGHLHSRFRRRHIGRSYDNRRAHAAGPARPILLMDNLANAPIGGAYLLALYEGEAGPQHVDWFWQAESMARCPDDGKVLFDRVGLPVVPGAQWRSTVHRPSGPPLGSKPIFDRSSDTQDCPSSGQ